MGDEEVNIIIIITKEDFQHYWRRKKERMTSPYSGRHFGYYKAASHWEYLSEVRVRMLSLVTKNVRVIVSQAMLNT